MRTRTRFRRLQIDEVLHVAPAESSIAIGNLKQIRIYSLVLASQRIPHQILRDKRGPYKLSVWCKYQESASQQIALYIQENPPQPENPPLALRFKISPLLILSLPAVLTLLQFSRYGSRWYHTGIADAEKILSGDWWRPITALTLHGNAHHLASNLISGYIVLNLLAFRLPLARIALPIAVASAVANFFVALTVQEDFRSLGFSTFVFCAIGTLGTIEFRLLPLKTGNVLRRFTPLFASALLAIFLGIGENADILSHFYGFALGLIVGFLPSKKSLLWGEKRTTLDFLFWILYFAFFAFAWRRAILLSLSV